MKIGILFDLDGTLLNSLEDLTDAVNYTLRFYGCPERSMEEIRTFIGNGAARLIRLSLPGKDTDPTVEAALATYQEYYGKHSQDKTRPYEGVAEALAELRKDFPIAIVSNKPDVAVKPLCADYFPGVFALGEHDGCPRKPAPDMLFAAMKAVGVEKCIYVGDSDVDVLTANNAVVPCLSVLWGYRDRACMEENGGKYFCSDIKEMAGALRKIAEECYGK